MCVHVCVGGGGGGITGQTPLSGEPWGTLMWLRSDHLLPLSPGLVTGNLHLSFNGKPKTSTRNNKGLSPNNSVIKTSLYWPHGMYRHKGERHLRRFDREHSNKVAEQAVSSTAFFVYVLGRFAGKCPGQKSTFLFSMAS